MNKQTLAKAVREGGMIERVHTVPSHGTYSNAEHTYGALSLLFVLYPGTPSMNLVKAMLWHDTAERWTGDVPGPMKYSIPELARLIEEVELACFAEMGIDFDLTEDEKKWLRAIDKIELWLWSHDQLALGNLNADEIQRTLYDLFMTGAIPLPRECQEFVREFRWGRLTDQPPTNRREA